MNSGMLPLRRCTFFWIVDFVYSMYNMQKKKENTNYDIWYDFIDPAQYLVPLSRKWWIIVYFNTHGSFQLTILKYQYK